MSEEPETGLRPGVERRLEFIEFRLYWEDGVNRADIMDQFGVSQPQASNDIAQYQRLAPLNLRYDTSLKRYLPSQDFQPIFLKPNAAQYLVELKSIADEVLSPADSWKGYLPVAGVMPIPGRRLNPEILRTLLKAIRESRSVQAHYHSMSDKRPEPIWRWLTPHSLGYDGLRWHIRAYCHIDSRFKDFVLSRFLAIAEACGEPGALPESDQDWHSFFDLELVPNPSIGPAKMRTVELDYGMVNGRLKLSVRRALLYYMDKRLRLDVGERLDKPHETPVVVANRPDFEKAIQDATGAVLLAAKGAA